MGQGKAITIDPLTRIEGHLGIKIKVADGKVSEAKVMGEMFRGFEKIMIGRHPMDAQQIIQRICGVCPVSQGMAAVLAQDMAYNIELPDNGRILRNLVQGANWMQDHISHFYVLSALDFIDVAAVLKYQGRDPVLKKMREWVKSQMASRQVIPGAPFLPRYEGKYISDLDANYMAVRHYAEALEMRALGHQMGASWVGKLPHAPGLVPGGMTCELDAKDIAAYSSMAEKILTFVSGAMFDDLLNICETFPEYWNIGKSITNYMAYGGFPLTSDPRSTFIPRGVIFNDKFENLDVSDMLEYTKYSKFKDGPGLHPTKGKTEADPNKPGAYSWIKAPRYKGQPMEVGPLARMLIMYHSGRYPEVKTLVDEVLTKNKQDITAMNSVLGRHTARVVETIVVCENLIKWVDQLNPSKKIYQPFEIPAKGAGVGMTEAARGGLAHWMNIDDRKVSLYQCIVPSTWTFSPRDDMGVAGPAEQALIGCPIADTDNPIEATRVVRSFDPCLACAVH